MLQDLEFRVCLMKRHKRNSKIFKGNRRHGFFYGATWHYMKLWTLIAFGIILASTAVVGVAKSIPKAEPISHTVAKTASKQMQSYKAETSSSEASQSSKASESSQGSETVASSSTSSSEISIQRSAAIDYGSNDNQPPSESLANSVMTDQVIAQLKTNSIEFNKTGAFVLNANKTDLDASVSSAPYVQLSELDELSRPRVANALLNKTSRQYQNRSATGNDQKIYPVGWNQLNLTGNYQQLYNRGHLIGYALAGSINGFDASEANYQNIATQTAWANQASNGDAADTGQNYFETLVRKAQDNNKLVRYRVTPIYDGNNLVPAGNQLEAKSSDGSLEFNVFVPNVEPGVAIDYMSGNATLK